MPANAMFKLMSSLLAGKEPDPAPVARPANLPAGERVYAVGDIHGRLDLLDAMIGAICADDDASAPANTTVILLGDLVDRGPDSAGVLARVREFQAHSQDEPGSRRRVRMLCGNHEEMFVRSFHEAEMLRLFLRHGGKETLCSYGVDRRALTAAELDEAQAMMRAAVPQADRDFIATFEDMIVLGDYVFVHAGVDPQAAMDDQRPATLRWIREPFLSHEGDLGRLVVHGHTISDVPVVRPHRIGVDTGAYASGRLTALVLEGEERRFIEVAGHEDGTVTANHRAA